MWLIWLTYLIPAAFIDHQLFVALNNTLANLFFFFFCFFCLGLTHSNQAINLDQIYDGPHT